MKILSKSELKEKIGKRNVLMPKRTVNLFCYVAGIDCFDEKLEEKNTFKVPNITDFEIHSNGIAIEMTHKFKRSKIGIKNDEILKITLEDTEQVYKQKEKSVVGRAIVGGLLFGSVGAIVGGLSGISDGKKKIEMPDLLLSIELGETDETKQVLIFSTKFKDKEKASKFFKEYYPNKFTL